MWGGSRGDADTTGLEVFFHLDFFAGLDVGVEAKGGSAEVADQFVASLLVARQGNICTADGAIDFDGGHSTRIGMSSAPLENDRI
jgi:hypothetical protein